MLENLKELRESKGLTQVQLAQLCKVSVAGYRLWESGGGKPTEENYKKLMEVLNVLPFYGVK